MKSAKEGLEIVDLVLDLQFEKGGVSEIADHLASKGEYDTVICASVQGELALPSGIGPKTRRIMFGPSAVLVPHVLMALIKEANISDKVKILIHPCAHAESIKGIRLWVGDPLVKNKDFKALVCTLDEWDFALMGSLKILAQGPLRGFSSGENQEFYSNPRGVFDEKDFTPCALLAGMAIPHSLLNKIIGVASCLPESSHPNPKEHYADQREIAKTGEMNVARLFPDRLYSFSFNQMQKAMWHCQPDEVFLNHADQVTQGELKDIIEQINIAADTRYCDAQVKHLGRNGQIEEREIEEIEK